MKSLVRLSSTTAKLLPFLPLILLWLILLIWQRWATVGVIPSDDALLIWEYYAQTISPSSSLAQAINLVQGEFNSIWLFLPLGALETLGILTYPNALTLAAAASLGVGLLIAAFLRWSGLNTWIASLVGVSIMLSLAQVEYLTFYVPIQHSITVLYAVLLTWLMASLLRSTPAQPFRSPRWWAWLALLGTSWTARTPILLVLILLLAGGLATPNWRRTTRTLTVGPIATFAVLDLLATLSLPGGQLLTLVERVCPSGRCSTSALSTAALLYTGLALIGIWAVVGLLPLKDRSVVSQPRRGPDFEFRVRGFGGFAAILALTLTLAATPIAVVGLLYLSPLSAFLLEPIPSRWLVAEVSLLAILVAASLWVVTLWTSQSAAAVAFVSTAIVSTSVYLASRGHLSGLMSTLPDDIDPDRLFPARYSLYVVVPFACATGLLGGQAWRLIGRARVRRIQRLVPTTLISLAILVLAVPWVAVVPRSVELAVRNLSDLRLANIAVGDSELAEATICTQGFTARWIGGQDLLPNFPVITFDRVKKLLDASPESMPVIASSASKEWSQGPCFVYKVPQTSIDDALLQFETVSGSGSPLSSLGTVGKGQGRSLTVLPDLYRVQGAKQVLYLSKPSMNLVTEAECATGSFVFDWEGAHVALESPDRPTVLTRSFPIVGIDDARLSLSGDGSQLSFSTTDYGETWELPTEICLDLDASFVEGPSEQSLTLIAFQGGIS
jgi:hypothetical protein